ncbi:diguanylate cyclase [Ectothiorhodospiraceae bacterium BW-2]|nr:diguanylate cyclase [Ectothiorhodospiraceae bacterium BW-2]
MAASHQLLSRVLVVDDSAAIRNLVEAHLREIEAPIEPLLAATMRECQVLLEQRGAESFLCAILDLNLPDAAEGEVVSLVQQHEIPVIILTSSVDKAICKTMSARLVIDYVVKRHLDEIKYIAQLVGHLYQNQSCRVMVVDDSRSFNQFIQRLLSHFRYQIVAAASAEEALRLLERYPDIGLVITDFNMPGMSGLELISQIRRRYRREELAIIGLSSSEDQQLIVQMLKIGANDYMNKPFIPEEFYCRVNQSVNMIRYTRRLKESAATDYLTQVYNRASLFELGEALYANAKRGDISIATAMIDADHFKSVNDTYGHDAGDRVLILMAQTLKATLRTSDIVARFGGEEFVAIAVIRQPDEARMVFEKVRQAIAAMSISLDNETKLQITVSIGVTTDLQHSLEQMLQLADQGVYRSKQSGRNRVTVMPS